jgi:hypothetical protein
MDRSRSEKIVGPFSFVGAGFFIGSYQPVSPISRYFRETVLSGEVPEGWWGSWVFQRATESLQRGNRDDFGINPLKTISSWKFQKTE